MATYRFPRSERTPRARRVRRDVALDRIAGDANGKRIPLRIASAVTEARLELTIEGAATITLTLMDPERSILRSKFLASGMGIYVLRGAVARWDRYGLAKVTKSGDSITLVYEDGAARRLQGYDEPMKAARSAITRAQFIARMAKEAGVPIYSPELLDRQPIAPQDEPTTDADPAGVGGAGSGFATTDEEGRSRGTGGAGNLPGNLTAKGAPMDSEQRQVASRILAVGNARKAPAAVLVAAIMTATVESVIRNLTGGDRDSAGAFQQRPSQGWGTYEQVTNVEYAAGQFYDRAIPAYTSNPTQSLNDLCQSVQRSGTPNAYGRWESEARKTVAAFTSEAVGTVGQAVQSFAYEFTRGNPESNERESSWEASGRLASEVGFRRFAYAGVLYYISDEELIRRRPRRVLGEFSRGVSGLDFDYDEGKPVASVRLTLDAERFALPPGAVVQLVNTGPAEGRYIVSSVSRSMFDTLMSVELISPQPKLPEPPAQSTSIGDGTGSTFGGGASTVDLTPSGGYSGTQGPLVALTDYAMQGTGVRVTSEKRARQTTTSGGTSDHYAGNTSAYARDMSDGSSPTPGMDTVATRIVEALGGPSDWGRTGGVFNTTINGIRWQVIYRSDVGGNHWNHVHVGARRA